MAKNAELPSLAEIDRRIAETVKDIEDAKVAGHAMMQDQYENDLIWLVDMKVRKQNEMAREMIEGVPV